MSDDPENGVLVRFPDGERRLVPGTVLMETRHSGSRLTRHTPMPRPVPDDMPGYVMLETVGDGWYAVPV